MKKRCFSFALALIVLALLLASCGSPLDKFEAFFVSVKKFDTETMGKYVDGTSADYFEKISSYAQMLSEDQTEIAKALFSYVGYTYNKEASAEAKSYDIKLSYVDFAALISTVEENMAIGTENASHYIKQILDSGNFEARYVKKADVTAVLSEDGKLFLGNVGENAELTRLLSLDVFLRWYSAQR